MSEIDLLLAALETKRPPANDAELVELEFWQEERQQVVDALAKAMSQSDVSETQRERARVVVERVLERDKQYLNQLAIRRAHIEAALRTMPRARRAARGYAANNAEGPETMPGVLRRA